MDTDNTTKDGTKAGNKMGKGGNSSLEKYELLSEARKLCRNSALKTIGKLPEALDNLLEGLFLCGNCNIGLDIYGNELRDLPSCRKCDRRERIR